MIKLGIAPIGWTNDDMPELGKNITFEQCISEMALAGYKKSDIKVNVQEGVLSIEGSASEDKEDFVHKGIAKRSFKRQLQLAEYVECNGAKLEDGMLKINLKHNPPEEKRAKQILIK